MAATARAQIATYWKCNHCQFPVKDSGDRTDSTSTFTKHLKTCLRGPGRISPQAPYMCGDAACAHEAFATSQARGRHWTTHHYDGYTPYIAVDPVIYNRGDFQQVNGPFEQQPPAVLKQLTSCPGCNATFGDKPKLQKHWGSCPKTRAAYAQANGLEASLKIRNARLLAQYLVPQDRNRQTLSRRAVGVPLRDMQNISQPAPPVVASSSRVTQAGQPSAVGNRSRSHGRQEHTTMPVSSSEAHQIRQSSQSPSQIPRQATRALPGALPPQPQAQALQTPVRQQSRPSRSPLQGMPSVQGPSSHSPGRMFARASSNTRGQSGPAALATSSIVGGTASAPQIGNRTDSQERGRPRGPTGPGSLVVPVPQGDAFMGARGLARDRSSGRSASSGESNGGRQPAKKKSRQTAQELEDSRRQKQQEAAELLSRLG